MTTAPLLGKNIWRLCKTYGRHIGAPELKPHDLRHGVAMATIRPARLKRAVSFYEEEASRMLGG